MGPIGVFDSGYGGLTVFKEIVKLMPQYDFVYLGDNARVPYGNRSFETVYHYTKECVEYLFENYDCPLIILACNTASAKALRQIQQVDLPTYPQQNGIKRVLGVIRPTAESIGHYTQNNKVGILATAGTVNSGSYLAEIQKFYPKIEIYQQACPLWVPFIEDGDLNSPALLFYIKKYVQELLAQSAKIDTIILACTHYPLIKDLIQEQLPDSIQLLAQDELVAQSLLNYLKNHPEIEKNCTKNAQRKFLTTDNSTEFQQKSSVFFGETIEASSVNV